MSFKAVFESTRANLREGRSTNPIHVKARSESQGGFRSIVKMRDFTLTLDQPKGFGGTNTGPKPSEVVLAALAACQEVTWRLYADALRIPLGSIAVELDGLQDIARVPRSRSADTRRLSAHHRDRHYRQSRPGR